MREVQVVMNNSITTQTIKMLDLMIKVDQLIIQQRMVKAGYLILLNLTPLIRIKVKVRILKNNLLIKVN